MKSSTRKPENKSKRKRTQKQIEAARRNGGQSRGPITDAGKALSSRNRIGHGLCAYKNLLLSNEDPAGLASLRAGYVFRFEPADVVEVDLVEQMVAAQWRLRRYCGVETALLDEEMHNQRKTLPPPAFEGERCARAFKSLADNSTSLALTGRYHSRLTRDYYRAMKAFLELRQKLPPPPGSNPEPKIILPGNPGADFPFEPETNLTPAESACRTDLPFSPSAAFDLTAAPSETTPDPLVTPPAESGPLNLRFEDASEHEAVAMQAREAIESSEGIERKGLVLATLMKLKQVCNHPAQFLKDNSALDGRSGKLTRLAEMLDETLEPSDRSLACDFAAGWDSPPKNGTAAFSR